MSGDWILSLGHHAQYSTYLVQGARVISIYSYWDAMWWCSRNNKYIFTVWCHTLVRFMSYYILGSLDISWATSSEARAVSAVLGCGCDPRASVCILIVSRNQQKRAVSCVNHFNNYPQSSAWMLTNDDIQLFIFVIKCMLTEY